MNSQAAPQPRRKGAEDSERQDRHGSERAGGDGGHSERLDRFVKYWSRAHRDWAQIEGEGDDRRGEQDLLSAMGTERVGSDHALMLAIDLRGWYPQ
jgi:hypothetical protein